MKQVGIPLAFGSLNEVKEIRDKALAIQAYARQAHDRDLVVWASEIRVRAERKAGELLREMDARGERAKPGEYRKESRNPTLSDIGVSKQQSSDWQTVARAPEEACEATALKAYARQAKNRTLEVDAAEIRFRAERRLGDMLVEQKETVGLNAGQLRRGSELEPRDDAPTLADAGIDKKLSMRAQRLAAIPKERFEEMIAEWRERVADENEPVAQTRKEIARAVSATVA